MRAGQRSANHPRRHERIPPGGCCTGDGITLPAKVGYTNVGKAGGCATGMPPDVECGGHLPWCRHVPACGRKPTGRALLHRSGRMRSTDEGCAGAAGRRIIIVQVWATVGATIHLGQGRVGAAGSARQGRVSAGPVAVAGCALMSWRGKGLQLVMMLSVGFFGGACVGALPDVVYVPRGSDVQRHVN